MGENEIILSEIILSVLTGLALFLYAVGNLSETLKDVVSNKARNLMVRFTRNLFTAILTGTVITIILDSSSAVIIMTIVLVNAKILNFQQSMGVVMGANIGTTFSSQLIALDVGKYSAIPLAIGLILMMVSKTKILTDVGRLLLFFGILFFGLYTMERAVEPLRGHPSFLAWMESLENPIRGALSGAVITLVIQSSSATVGMVITLAKKGLISLAAGIAVMLGAELGTCSDTLLATINSSRQALKTGLFHLIFNIVSIVLGLIAFVPFVSLIDQYFGEQDLKNQIANAHVIFNVMGVLLFFPFVPLFERLLNKWIKEKPGEVSTSEN